MIVYVIKRNDGTYYKRCIDSIIMFEKEISSAEFYLDKSRVEEIVHFIIKRKHLYNILPEELNIVEVQVMETTELAKHDKQVRKEVCEKIRENAISHNNLEVDMYYITPQQLYEIEQGETNEI